MSDLPLVLIVGDSISIGYTPFVEKELEGRARVVHHEGNGGDSNNVLGNLGPVWLPALGETPALIHANAGLHDLRFWPAKGEYQVTLESYRKNVGLLAQKLLATGAKVIWATSTPILDGAPNMSRDFPRKNSDVEAYNAAAVEAMTAAGIEVDDLYALVEKAGREKLVTPDGVHLTEDGYRALGVKVAEAVRQALGL
ncbi:MAG: SGNH/GDSL hydrolase family protein [Planctomycetota bacterium]|jgi:acyl-CoA thioesterase-1